MKNDENKNEDYRLMDLVRVAQEVRQILIYYFENTLRRIFDTRGIDLYIGPAKHYVHEFVELYRRHNILVRGCPVNIQYIVNDAVAMMEDSFQHCQIANSHQVFVPNEHNIMTFGGTLIFIDMEQVYPAIYGNIMHVDDVIKALQSVIRHEIGHVYANKNIFMYKSFEDYNMLMDRLSAERGAQMKAVERLPDPEMRLKKYAEMPEEVWADKAGFVTPEDRILINKILGYRPNIVKISAPDIDGKSRRDI